MEPCCGKQPKRYEDGPNHGFMCEECGRLYYHPTMTWEQMERVWNYRLRGGDDGD